MDFKQEVFYMHSTCTFNKLIHDGCHTNIKFNTYNKTKEFKNNDYERIAILTPLNSEMRTINELCLDRWRGKLETRYGFDSMEDCDREMIKVTSTEVSNILLIIR